MVVFTFSNSGRAGGGTIWYLASTIDKSSSKGVVNCQSSRPGTLNSGEHIPDLINKFDLVLHSISRLREYDRWHIVGSMVEYRSVYNIRVMPFFQVLTE